MWHLGEANRNRYLEHKFAVINYIGFHDRGMLLAGGCGDTNGKPQINKTKYLKEAYEFGKTIYLL